jgi:hypothetical protein
MPFVEATDAHRLDQKIARTPVEGSHRPLTWPRRASGSTTFGGRPAREPHRKLRTPVPSLGVLGPRPTGGLS